MRPKETKRDCWVRRLGVPRRPTETQRDPRRHRDPKRPKEPKINSKEIQRDSRRSKDPKKNQRDPKGPKKTLESGDWKSLYQSKNPWSRRAEETKSHILIIPVIVVFFAESEKNTLYWNTNTHNWQQWSTSWLTVVWVILPSFTWQLFAWTELCS